MCIIILLYLTWVLWNSMFPDVTILKRLKTGLGPSAEQSFWPGCMLALSSWRQCNNCTMAIPDSCLTCRERLRGMIRKWTRANFGNPGKEITYEMSFTQHLRVVPGWTSIEYLKSYTCKSKSEYGDSRESHCVQCAEVESQRNHWVKGWLDFFWLMPGRFAYLFIIRA